MNKFIVGSKAFFNEYKDFVPHDEDVLLIDDNPTDYQNQMQIHIKGKCYFRWRRMGKEELIEYHKPCKCGMFIGKFLVPDFAKEIGLTIEDLKELEFLTNNLDERHLYEKIIYDSYIENGDFVLTDEQRLKAYNEYKRLR